MRARTVMHRFFFWHEPDWIDLGGRLLCLICEIDHPPSGGYRTWVGVGSRV